MSTIQDPEFGEIIIRRSSNSSRITLRISPDGKLRVMAPKRTPLIAVKTLIKTSRNQIRELLVDHRSTTPQYTDNRTIGKSHSLIFNQSSANFSVKTVGTKIIVDLSDDDEVGSVQIQQDIREAIIKALRKEAKSYLPRRLSYLAQMHDFKYSTTKLTHASSRWGSCSSSGTISMNISLMQLPFELLDYVLVHELCHTRHMNHSQAFWDEVESIDPKYKIHRRNLKKYSPHV